MHVSSQIFLSIALSIGAVFTSWADDILSEDIGNLTWKYTVSNGTARVYGGHMKTAIGWTTGEVVVPDMLGGLPVTVIGSYAFYEMTGISSLIIPEGVETIEFYACRGCSGLQSVSLPSTLKTMGNAVFCKCESLLAGSIPDSVTSMGRDTFWGCKAMTSVKFSENVTSLGTMTCYNCDSLTEVTVPECVTNVGISAFLDCDNLRAVTLPAAMTGIGNYAFNNCVSLEEVNLPSGVTNLIGSFSACTSLTTIRIRRETEGINPEAFRAFPRLSYIVVEAGNESYKSIDGALYDITGEELVSWPAALAPVTIPSSVQHVGDYAFWWQTDRSAIEIADGITISEHAFGDPPEEGPDEPEEPGEPEDPIVPEVPREGIVVYRDCFRIVPGQIPHLACVVTGLEGIDYAVDDYEPNNWRVVIHGWGMDDPRIKNSKPGEHLVDDNDMPAGVYEVVGTAQPFVFEFCNWYRKGVLGSHTWYGYISIALDANGELVILESAICNEQNVLSVSGCPSPIPSLDFKTEDHGDWLEIARSSIPRDTSGWMAVPSEINGKPVRAIGRYAFANCASVWKVSVPDSVQSIGDRAFIGCRSLAELVIPDSVTNVGERVAYECDALGELRVGSGLKSIGYGAFAGTGMTNLVLSAGVTNVEGYAFAANSRLRTMTVPPSVERIKRCAFDGCTSLSAVSVPYATVVEDGAFPQGCVVSRYGPAISPCGDLPEPDEETKSALMRTLGWRLYDQKSLLRIADIGQLPAATSTDDGAPYACAHLGISPLSVDLNDGMDYITAYYKMPAVECLGIDPATRTITGRVVPAEGTSIVSEPLRRAFGFYRIYEGIGDGRLHEGTDWGYLMARDHGGFSLDFSDYMNSNGVFRITYPEEVLYEKEPQPAHLFRIRLSDKEAFSW